MKKTLKTVINVVLWLFVAFAVAITVLVLSSQQNDSGLPTLMGKRMVNILTNSMEPTFRPGDLILIDTVSVDESHELKEGDIITYFVDLNGDGNDEINTHRIISAYEEGGYTYYITKGDNNSASDLPVVSHKILGVYAGTRLSGIGKVMTFLQTQMGFLCVIVLPLALFFLFELYNFITAVNKIKGKKMAAEDEERIRREAVEEYLRRQQEVESTKNGTIVQESESIGAGKDE